MNTIGLIFRGAKLCCHMGFVGILFLSFSRSSIIKSCYYYKKKKAKDLNFHTLILQLQIFNCSNDSGSHDLFHKHLSKTPA